MSIIDKVLLRKSQPELDDQELDDAIACWSTASEEDIENWGEALRNRPSEELGKLAANLFAQGKRAAHGEDLETMESADTYYVMSAAVGNLAVLSALRESAAEQSDELPR